jgi:hypothetical protein
MRTLSLMNDAGGWKVHILCDQTRSHGQIEVFEVEEKSIVEPP